MSNNAIEVENLGKCYQIGELEDYYTLRDSLTNFIKYPYNLISKNSRNKQKSEIEFIWALRDLNFEVKKGEIIGIIGRNGAGKSTLLKVLSRITTPTEGKVKINGRVGSLLEVGTGFHPELTGRENIYLNGSILGMSKKEIERKFDEIVNFAETEKFLDTPVKRYSSGMYVRLAFAVAAHMEPEILIIDEVLAVGDIAFQKKCLGKMDDVSKEGRTVLFVSHNMASISKLCNKAIWLHGGKLNKIGNVESIVRKYIDSVTFNNDTKNILPLHNTKYGVGIIEIDFQVSEADNINLDIYITIQSKDVLKNIGFGLIIKNYDGYRLSSISPIMTNHVVDSFKGKLKCKFHCESIDKYLSGGDYLLDFWLSKPRIEYILQVENIIEFTIPKKDIYRNGVYFENTKDGPIPLSFTFEDKGD